MILQMIGFDGAMLFCLTLMQTLCLWGPACLQNFQSVSDFGDGTLNKVIVGSQTLFMKVCVCTGFGWNRVNIFHSISYGATFQICGQNNVDNTGMFSLLLNSAYTAPRPLNKMLFLPNTRHGSELITLFLVKPTRRNCICIVQFHS